MNTPQGILPRGYQYPMAIFHPTYYGEAWCSKNFNFWFQLKPKLLLVSQTCVDTPYLANNGYISLHIIIPRSQTIDLTTKI